MSAAKIKQDLIDHSAYKLFQEPQFINCFHFLGEPLTPLKTLELVHINSSPVPLLDYNSETLNNDFFQNFACGKFFVLSVHTTKTAIDVCQMGWK